MAILYDLQVLIEVVEHRDESDVTRLVFVWPLEASTPLLDRGITRGIANTASIGLSKPCPSSAVDCAALEPAAVSTAIRSDR